MLLLNRGMENDHLAVIKNLSVLPKVSEDCPLECVYCYEGKKKQKIMDDKTLEKMIEIIEGRQCAESTSYIWHGAEPLTAGIGFYEKALELQKRYRKKQRITNSMQSSGVLLTPEFADFLKANNIHIGFSLDGPKHVHDLTRRYRGGGSSFEETMQAIRLMQERGERVGVIAVLSKLTLPYLDETYTFFKEEGIDFKINPIMDWGNARGKEGLLLKPREKVKALKYLFDLWFFDQSKEDIECDSLLNVTKAMLTGHGNSCETLHSCQESFISVGSDGTIYPCSRFSGEEITYGSIHEVKRFEEIAENKTRKTILGRYEKLSECNVCDYKELCYGGCMHSAHSKGNILEKDPNCEVNKAIYEHIAKRVIEELSKGEQ